MVKPPFICGPHEAAAKVRRPRTAAFKVFITGARVVCDVIVLLCSSAIKMRTGHWAVRGWCDRKLLIRLDGVYM